jgi:hypothetical protein
MAPVREDKAHGQRGLAGCLLCSKSKPKLKSLLPNPLSPAEIVVATAPEAVSSSIPRVGNSVNTESMMPWTANGIGTLREGMGMQRRSVDSPCKLS